MRTIYYYQFHLIILSIYIYIYIYMNYLNYLNYLKTNILRGGTNQQSAEEREEERLRLEEQGLRSLFQNPST